MRVKRGGVGRGISKQSARHVSGEGSRDGVLWRGKAWCGVAWRDRAGQGRAGQGRVGQGRAGQGHVSCLWGPVEPVRPGGNG
eukprot:56624-Chlamydomonas_euryale.AAC.1